MADSKVVIDIIAPNSRTFNLLEFVLQQHGKGRFELSRGNRPQLVVVDFDKSDVLTIFRKFRSRFPQIPAVLLLNQSAEYEALPAEVRIGSEFVLLKPFAAKDFISRIDECLDRITLSSGQAGTGGQASPGAKQAPLSGPGAPQVSGRERTVPLQTSADDQIARPNTRPRTWTPLENEEIAYSFDVASDIDMANEVAVAGLWLKTEHKLLGYLQSALTQQVSSRATLCISVGNDVCFHISPYAKSITLVGEAIDLQALARRDFAGNEIVLSERAMSGMKVQSKLEMECFLWKLALFTYRGRLPEGISVNKPVYLKYWPNLTRLEPTPDAMRIASLLSRQPVALAFIVRILNIPQRHVFNFYSAASTIGYAGPAVREVDSMLLPSYPDEFGAGPARGYVDSSATQNKSTR